MRVIASVVLLGALAIGRAEASSFVVMGGDTPAATPSIRTLGQEPAHAPGRSIVAPSGIPMSDEQVAAIAADPAAASGTPLLVIRGGVFGEAAPDPVALAAPGRTLSRPQQRKIERDLHRAIREGRAPVAEAPSETAAPAAAAPPDRRSPGRRMRVE